MSTKLRVCCQFKMVLHNYLKKIVVTKNGSEDKIDENCLIAIKKIKIDTESNNICLKNCCNVQKTDISKKITRLLWLYIVVATHTVHTNQCTSTVLQFTMLQMLDRFLIVF